jgi:hypothetical protein
VTRATLRQQTLAALKAMPPRTSANKAAALAVLQPLYNSAVAAKILGTEVTTLRTWIGVWSALP